VHFFPVLELEIENRSKVEVEESLKNAKTNLSVLLRWEAGCER
jgi:hypothetical protein